MRPPLIRKKIRVFFNRALVCILKVRVLSFKKYFGLEKYLFSSMTAIIFGGIHSLSVNVQFR